MSKFAIGSKVIIGHVPESWDYFTQELIAQAGMLGVVEHTHGNGRCCVKASNGESWWYPPESLELFDGIKTGDTVRCVNARLATGKLIDGQEYSVRDIRTYGDKSKICVKGNGVMWLPERFEFVARPPTVPAVDYEVGDYVKFVDRKSVYAAAVDALQIGSVYRVDSIVGFTVSGERRVGLEGVSTRCYPQSCFVKAEAPVPARKFIVVYANTHGSDIPLYDSEEEANAMLEKHAPDAWASHCYHVAEVVSTRRNILAVPAVPARVEVVL